jgi:hypothetical protein
VALETSQWTSLARCDQADTHDIAVAWCFMTLLRSGADCEICCSVGKIGGNAHCRLGFKYI